MKKKDDLVLEQDKTELESEVREIDLSFCRDWKLRIKASEAEIREWVEGEIERLIQENKLVLSSILIHQSGTVKTFALQALQKLGINSFQIKLVNKDQWPLPYLPIHDPNGALLPEAKRGKVFCAKVGTRAEYDFSATNPEVIDTEYTGAAFKQHQKLAKLKYGYKSAPYVSREVTEKPSLFTQKEAVILLNKYGFSISLKESNWWLEEV